MQYDIFVQGKLYTTITTEGGYSLSEINNLVHNDVEKGSLKVNDSEPLQVQVVPKI